MPHAATAAAAPRPAANAGRFEPDAPPPAGRSWLATGIYIMALPVTLGMSLMFAPVTWLLGGRPKR